MSGGTSLGVLLRKPSYLQRVVVGNTRYQYWNVQYFGVYSHDTFSIKFTAKVVITICFGYKHLLLDICYWNHFLSHYYMENL